MEKIKRPIRLSSHFLVALQFTGIFLSFYPYQRQVLQQPYFLALSVLGGILGLLTLAYNRIGNFRIYPEPRKKMRLITSGPYSFVRHPMYTSLVLVLSGTSLCLDHFVNYLGLALVVGAVFLKAQREERFLGALFPEYGEYTKKTYRFIPFVF